MSEIVGFKCDMCGKVIMTGRRVSGNNTQRIKGQWKEYKYRYDLCDDCFGVIRKMCEKKANTVSSNIVEKE